MRKTSFAIIALVLLACGRDKKPERPSSPRIRKETKVVSPKQNQKLTLGEEVTFQIQAAVQLDSVVVVFDSERQVFTSDQFNISISSKKVGSKRFKTTTYFGGKSETHSSKVIYLADTAPEEYGYKIVNTYPHDKEDYTQGLLISDGFLYESTGQNGTSRLEKKEIKSGKTIQQIHLSDDYFGEGLALVNDQFYQITYTSGACFVYNQEFEEVNSFSYQGEGWGLSEFNGNILMTNRTEKIVVRDPKTFSVIDEIEVYDHQGKVDSINELEIIDGLIYANVYLEEYILVIDPNTGAVVRKIDMSNLLSESDAREVDMESGSVLNGIAYDSANDRVFVTGKLWPKLYEVKFIKKNNL